MREARARLESKTIVLNVRLKPVASSIIRTGRTISSDWVTGCKESQTMRVCITAAERMLIHRSSS